MGETLGSGKIVKDDLVHSKVITYNIAISDLSSTTRATPTQVANLIADIKASAAANNLKVRIDKAESDLV